MVIIGVYICICKCRIVVLVQIIRVVHTAGEKV